MIYRSFIAGLFLVAAFAGVAHADDAVTPGATLIDITGEVETAGLAGGVADQVPLFVGSSGPVIFVMNTNPGEEAVARAQQTHIRANPELNRR